MLIGKCASLDWIRLSIIQIQTELTQSSAFVNERDDCCVVDVQVKSCCIVDSLVHVSEVPDAEDCCLHFVI